VSLVDLDIGLPASSAADAPLSSGTFLIHLRDKGEECPRPPSAPPPVRIPYRDAGKDWRAPSERIRTASEIPIEMDLTDEDAVPAYMKIAEKALYLSRLGMTYTSVAEHLGVNLWIGKRATHWGKAQTGPQQD
jgi:hypothetical protein